MFVGVARFVLQVPGARSLKDRRMVVKSFKDRVRARFSVSVAEVGDVSRYQVATLGVVAVARSAHQCEDALARVKATANSLKGALLIDAALEVLPFGKGGNNVRGSIESWDTELDSNDQTFDDELFEDEES